MPDSTWSNPFYNEVDKTVARELKARASAYGAQIRSPEGDVKSAKNIMWSYGKTAYAFVKSGKWVLGSSWDSMNFKFNNHGGLNGGLYGAQRFQPRFPLLQNVEITNEGTAGSLIKGKFTFLYYPVKNADGFDFDSIEQQFCKPGLEVEITAGWTVSAANKEANRLQVTGIIYNFDWSINNDLSYTVNVSIVSKGTLAIGISADSSTSDESDKKKYDSKVVKDSKTTDASGKEVIGSNLSTMIDKDMQGNVNKVITTLQVGSKQYIDKSQTESKIFGYYLVAFRWNEGDDKKGENGNSAPVKGFCYVKLGDIVEYFNTQLKGGYNHDGEEIKSAPFEIMKINAHNPIQRPQEVAHNWILSATPQDILFPAPETSTYDNLSPFASPSMSTNSSSTSQQSSAPSEFTNWSGSPSGSFVAFDGKMYNIYNILVNTQVVKSVFDELVEKASITPEYKNITTFFDEINKKINYASGDIIQLTCWMREHPEDKRPNNATVDPTAHQATLEIVDSNYTAGIPDSSGKPSRVMPFIFRSNINGAIIKSINMSSKPPAASAAAAYVGTRADKNVSQRSNNNNDNSKGKPIPTERDTRLRDERSGSDDEFLKAMNDFKAAAEKMGKTGISTETTEELRSAISKIKKTAGTAESVVGKDGEPKVPDASWMTTPLYPIDMSLTIDGIDGFKFGNVISTDLMPRRYWGRLVYVITRIRHSISSGVWETTLETKSRLAEGMYEGTSYKPSRPRGKAF